MTAKKSNFLEQIFESLLWKSRLIVLVAVIFSVIGAGALFYAGSLEIWHTLGNIIPKDGHTADHIQLLIGIISAIDLYLIGIVLLIFAFGIYELFISKIDIAINADGTGHNILEISSLDELKSKLLKVIIMVLIVSFFKAVLSYSFKTPLEMLYLAIAILAVSACTYFLRHIEHNE